MYLKYMYMLHFSKHKLVQIMKINTFNSLGIIQIKLKQLKHIYMYFKYMLQIDNSYNFKS